MKIWSVQLSLFTNKGELEMNFLYEKKEREDFKPNEESKQWTAYEDYMNYRVPMNMVIQDMWGVTATQGFDYDLSEQEQSELKQNMIKKTIEYLEYKKKKQNEFYDKRIKFMQEQ